MATFRTLAFHCSLPTLSSSSSSSSTRTVPPRRSPSFPPSWGNILQAAVAGTLSLGLLVSTTTTPNSSLGATVDGSLAQHPTEEICREAQEVGGSMEDGPGVVTNEGIVEEAWEVVNESFLDAGNHGWTPEKWLLKKNDILSSRIQSRSRAHDIIQRMLSSLHDPYTRFLSSAELSRMAKYDITGIGINLREVPDDSGAVRLKVLGILLDGPAHSAGVKQGDELLSVNGVNVIGKSAFEASSLLQGPTETFVTIEVKHGNCGPAQSIKVQRKLVARTPVFYRLEKVENGISVGYIHLKEFNALARKDLIIAMKRLQESGASFFVLDLRDNLGGLVQAGVEVAKLFLDKGDTVIYTVGRDPQVQRNITAEFTPKFAVPVIILVNNRTASASEIVAAALHDHCKAVLVGEQTFGKGLIQSVFELRDGSGMVVTIGKYVTPNHVDINDNGIEPDLPRIPTLSEVRNLLLQCQIQRKS